MLLIHLNCYTANSKTFTYFIEKHGFNFRFLYRCAMIDHKDTN